MLDPLLRLDGFLTENGLEAVTGLDPKQFLGIPFALLGAALLAFGAQYQSRGLNKVERIVGKSAGSGLSFTHVLSLLRRPSWVSGTLLLGLAVVFQLVSLSLSPLIIVQPLGVVGLVITSILNSRISGVKLDRRVKTSIALAFAGIVVFVSIAAFSAADQPVTNTKLIIILVTYLVLLLLTLLVTAMFRHRGIALIYIVGAGLLYGFVATFAKVVIGRFQQGEFDWLTWVCVLALASGALLGMVYVQNAYSSGPPDLVVAGLTVIDPIVAVLIGIIVLGEAAGASVWAVLGFVVSGVVAVIGVLGLAKYHPQSGASALDAKAEEGETGQSSDGGEGSDRHDVTGPERTDRPEPTP
ncbi:MAG: DMT family transporter [Leucobacter sp.]